MNWCVCDATCLAGFAEAFMAKTKDGGEMQGGEEREAVDSE